MALRVLKAQIEAICEHAERDYPAECCGALLGRCGETGKTVERVLALANVHEDGPARRFRISDKEMYRLYTDSRAQGLEIVGFYHSHPDHPADPSEYDREHAWPLYSYVIVSVAAGKAGDIKSWVLAEDGSRYEAEQIEVN